MNTKNLQEPELLRQDGALLTEEELPLKRRPTLTGTPVTALSRRSGAIFKAGSPAVMGEVAPFHFNYSCLPSDAARELRNTTTEVRVLYRASLQSLAKVGFFLTQAKELLEYGQWMDWIEKEFVETGYFSHSAAENYMNLARAVSKYGMENIKRFPLAVAYKMGRSNAIEEVNQQLLDLPPEQKVTRTLYEEIKAQHTLSNPPPLDQEDTEITVDDIEDVEVLEEVKAANPLIPPLSDREEEELVISEQLVVETPKHIQIVQIKAPFSHPESYDLIVYATGVFNDFQFSHKELNDIIIKLQVPNTIVITSPVHLSNVLEIIGQFELPALKFYSVDRPAPFLYPDLNLRGTWLVAIESCSSSAVSVLNDSYPSLYKFLYDFVSAHSFSKTLFYQTSSRPLIEDSLLIRIGSLTELHTNLSISQA